MRSTSRAPYTILISILVTLPLTWPVAGQLSIIGPFSESPPTSEDLNSLAVGSGGESIIVGDNATVLRRLDNGEAISWQSLDSWAAGFFSAEIFDVTTSPVSLGGQPTYALAGRGTVVETNFNATTVVDDRPADDAIFTPVLPTASAIWYGEPNFTPGAPGLIWRFDRATSTPLGLAVFSPVADICPLPGGGVRYVTLEGDVFELSEQLQRTSVFDQVQPLTLTFARFAAGCRVVLAGGVTGSASFANFTIDLDPSTGSPLADPQSHLGDPLEWTEIPLPGDSLPTSAAPAPRRAPPPGNAPGLADSWWGTTSCNDLQELVRISVGLDVAGSFSVGFEGVQLVSAACPADVYIDVGPGNRPSAPNETAQGLLSGTAPPSGALEILTVGENGTVWRFFSSALPTFFDGFESGNVAAWASSAGSLP